MTYEERVGDGFDVGSIISAVGDIGSSLVASVGASNVAEAQASATKAQAEASANIAQIQADTAKYVAGLQEGKNNVLPYIIVGGAGLLVTLGLIMAVRK